MSDRGALFAELQQGLDITKGLKHLSKEEKARRKLAAKEAGPAKVPMKASAPTKPKPKIEAVKKDPVFELVANREWRVENQEGSVTTMDDVKFNHVINIRDCSDYTLIINQKCASICMENCVRSNVVFNGLVSGLEFIKCKNVKSQILEGQVRTITVDQTHGAHYYLNKDSRDCQITSSCCTGNNVWFPSLSGAEDEIVSMPIPEQFTSTVKMDKDEVDTKVSDLYLEQ